MKKTICSLIASAMLLTAFSQQNVAINNTGAVANSSAMLDVSSTTKGMLIPRMDSTQRKAILNKAVGLMVFDTNTNSFWYYQNSGWTELQTVNNNPWQNLNNNIYNSNTGNVGIGTNTPLTKLHVKTTDINPVTFDGGAPTWITIAENGTNRGYIGSYAGYAEDVDFGTYASNSTGRVHLTTGNIARLSVIPGGNVGINNLTPGRKLDVKGDIRTDSLFLNNMTFASSDFLILKDANGQVGHQKSFNGVALNYCISLYGIFPSRSRPAPGSDTITVAGTAASSPYVGEIMLFAGNFAPTGWAFCDGSLISIASNTALFSLLGTQYGGNGQTTFALPDLRDAVPVGFGTRWTQGENNRQ